MPPRRLLCLLVLIAGTVAAGAACGEAAPPQATPNIVLIVSDDHGWPYFGFMGDEVVRTPHLDALAEAGVVFTTGYTTASTCRPSLRSLLTGLYPEQWSARRAALAEKGVALSKAEPIRDFSTLPKLLAARGYASFQGGKYWDGGFEGAGFTSGMARLEEPAPRGSPEWVKGRAGGDSTDLGRSTMQPLWDFLEANRDRPFFVFYAPKLPHTPHDAPAEFTSRYDSAALSPASRGYYANITRFDATVGAIVARLEALGLREKTLLVVLSDNGWEQGAQQANRVKALGGPKGKSSMYELGFRTPVVFHWPGRIPPGRRDDLVDEVDVFATLLDWAGAAAPPDRLGISLRSAVLEGTPSPRRSLIGGMSQLRPPPAAEAARADPNANLVRSERAYFLRNASWHYIWYADSARSGDRPEAELFRIDEDPWETRDVAPANPELVERFRAEVERWLQHVRERTRAAI